MDTKNTAKLVIERFGGQVALAALLGKGQSTVQYWSKAGLIPAKWQPILLKLAEEKGVQLSSSDFIQRTTQPTKLTTPDAKWMGILPLGEAELPVYVLDDGRRVLSRTGATGLLTDNRGGGNLESYLSVNALKDFRPENLLLIEFTIQGVVNKNVQGFEAEMFLEICRGYVTAWAKGALKTDRQIEIATKCSMFLAACAKVGLIALIDEATGYQYDRAEDALRVKLRAFLEKEMRPWEKTFPDELWVEFARLTKWQGSVTQRPKYWGKLVMELVYEYLDADVADWLKTNAPKPKAGQNYHQWMSSQYGLQKLMQHIWMLIGMAKSCESMPELRQKMGEQFGRIPIQLTLYMNPLKN